MSDVGEPSTVSQPLSWPSSSDMLSTQGKQTMSRVEPEFKCLCYLETRTHVHKPVGSLAGRDRGAGVKRVGVVGVGAQAAVRAAQRTHSLHGHTGVPACLTHTLLFAPTDREQQVSVSKASCSNLVHIRSEGSDLLHSSETH